MKKYLSLFICTCVLGSTAFAAQRDMSMSAEESFQQHAIKQNKSLNNTGTGFDNNVQLDPDMAQQMRDIQQRNSLRNDTLSTIGGANAMPTTLGIATRRSFMVNFCDDNLSRSAIACQNAERTSACDRFRQSPVEVQRLLDHAINCEYAASRNDGMGVECDGLDANRLDLLKQYWQDENTSYTLLFLPDMVLNASTKCLATGVKR